MVQFKVWVIQKALLFCVALWCSLTVSADTVLLDESSERVLVRDTVRYIEDVGRQYSLDDIVAMPERAWSRDSGNYPNFGFSDSHIWFLIGAQNVSAASQAYVLLSDYTALDEIDFFLVDRKTAQVTTTFNTGDHKPMSSRPIEHAAYAFPFSLAPQQEVQLLVRVSGRGNLVVPLSLWERSLFFQSQKNFYTLFSTVIGIMGVTALYNLFIFFRTRETLFLFFSAFAFSTVLLYTSQAGLGL